MLYLLNIITLFVALYSMIYYASVNDKGQLANRFILCCSFVMVIDSVFGLLVPFEEIIHLQSKIIAIPPFIIWIGTFLFLFMLELLERKKLSIRTILLNLLPPFSMTVVSLGVAYFGKLSSYGQQSFLIFRYSFCLLLIIIYYANISIRRTKINTFRHNTPQVLTILLVQLQVSWIFSLVWLVQFPLFGMLYSFQLYVFLKLALVSMSITFYFYLFGLSRSKLENEKKQRMRGFKRLLVQSSFDTSYNPSAIVEDDTPSRDRRYEKSSLDDKMLHEYAAVVFQFIEENPASYLKQQFNLEYLSLKTGISHYNLSQVFNDALQITFSNFLNKKRIDFACSQLDKTAKKDINITQLSEMCGYKSRTSFYQNFKKVTGLSPAEYIQKHTKR